MFKWTGKRWVISLTQEKGNKTLAESKLKDQKDFLEQEKKGKLFKNFIKFFSDAELIEIIKKN